VFERLRAKPLQRELDSSDDPWHSDGQISVLPTRLRKTCRIEFARSPRSEVDRVDSSGLRFAIDEATPISAQADIRRLDDTLHNECCHGRIDGITALKQRIPRRLGCFASRTRYCLMRFDRQRPAGWSNGRRFAPLVVYDASKGDCS
jgi:hypothetical protein